MCSSFFSMQPMVPSCPPSFPLNVQIVCTNCDINCTDSLADLQKYTSLTVNCSLPAFEQFQATIVLTNLEGSDALPMNFCKYTCGINNCCCVPS